MPRPYDQIQSKLDPVKYIKGKEGVACPVIVINSPTAGSRTWECQLHVNVLERSSLLDCLHPWHLRVNFLCVSKRNTSMYETVYYSHATKGHFRINISGAIMMHHHQSSRVEAQVYKFSHMSERQVSCSTCQSPCRVTIKFSFIPLA